MAVGTGRDHGHEGVLRSSTSSKTINPSLWKTSSDTRESGRDARNRRKSESKRVAAVSGINQIFVQGVRNSCSFGVKTVNTVFLLSRGERAGSQRKKQHCIAVNVRYYALDESNIRSELGCRSKRLAVRDVEY